jgi:hypothetical protein
LEHTGRKPWVVWKDGDLVGTLGTAGTSYRPASLNAALSAVASATQGGSMVVPQLLMPRALRTSNVLSVITDPAVKGEEKVDGHAAYRIEGLLWEEPITLWIDSAQYLILKVYRKTSIANRVQEVTFQFKAKLNSDVSPDRLKAPQGETQIVTTAVNSRLDQSGIGFAEAKELRFKSRGHSAERQRLRGGDGRRRRGASRH